MIQIFDDMHKHDMYELLAIRNCPDKVKFNGELNFLKEIDEHTDFNRCLGIDIGCYDSDIDKLKYPLKLTSVSFKGNYEDLNKPSYGDPDQGFGQRKRDINLDLDSILSKSIEYNYIVFEYSIFIFDKSIFSASLNKLSFFTIFGKFKFNS